MSLQPKFAYIYIYSRFVVAVSYYGLTLNITSISGDKYINLFISGALELPAYGAAVFVLNRFVVALYLLISKTNIIFFMGFTVIFQKIYLYLI